MEERIERAVRRINEAQADGESLQSMLDEVERDLGGSEAVELIAELQEEKRVIMWELKEGLRQLDEEGTVGEAGRSRQVSWDETQESALIYGKGGVTTPVSKGQLLVSGMWGESYYLNEAVPRALKKQYLIEHAKARIADLYDHQIAISEMNKSYNRNTGRDDAYTAIHEQHESGELPTGVIAERMVESYLTKVMHDHDVPFSIKKVSIYMDVEYKIDFIIEPKEADNVLGVGVEEPEVRHDIGIQFTTAKSERTREHKEKQLENTRAALRRGEAVPVEDLVLVTLPLEHVEDIYREWQETKSNRRTPGGPDMLWPEEVKRTVFFALLDKVLSPQQRESVWAAVEATH